MLIQLSKDEYQRLQAIKEGEGLRTWREALTAVIMLGSKKHFADAEKKEKKYQEDRTAAWEALKAEGRKGTKPAKRPPPSKRGPKGRASAAKRSRA